MKLNIKHIKKTTNRHGVTYYYCKITNKRIKSDPKDSLVFCAEVEALRQGLGSDLAALNKKGTLAELIAAYKASPEFSTLKPRTRKDYNKIFDYLQPLSQVEINDIAVTNCIRMRDKAYASKKRWFANYLLKVGSIIYNWGCARGYCENNPFGPVPKIAKTPEEKQRVMNRAWAEDEVHTVLKFAKPNLAVAIALGYFFGLRQGDVLNYPLIQPEVINGQKFMKLRQSKTSEEITLPVYPEFEEYIDIARALPNRQAVNMVINERGLPYTSDGFRTLFFRHIRKLESEGLVRPGLTFHGLRHTVATELANADAGDSTIQHALGHKSPTMAQNYRRSKAKTNSVVEAMNLRRK